MDAIDGFRKASSGWRVYYELFDIEGDPARCFATKFELAEDEILLQFRQSLRPSISSWKLNFPMTIGNSLRKFTILRTLFDLAEVESWSSAEAPIFHCCLQRNLDRSSAKNWNAVRQFFGHRYFYKFYFSSDDQFLIFQDHDMIDAPAVNLAVYHLGHANQKLYGTAINHFEADESYEGHFQLTVHPHLPYVMFMSNLNVVLWRFDSGELTALKTIF